MYTITRQQAEKGGSQQQKPKLPTPTTTIAKCFTRNKMNEFSKWDCDCDCDCWMWIRIANEYKYTIYKCHQFNAWPSIYYLLTENTDYTIHIIIHIHFEFRIQHSYLLFVIWKVQIPKYILFLVIILDFSLFSYRFKILIFLFTIHKFF